MFLNKMLLCFAITIVLITGCTTYTQRDRDNYVRDRTVKLMMSNGGNCTGTMIHSPWNGKYYMLTAAHCIDRVLPLVDRVRGITELGQSAYLRVLKVNFVADIAVLECPWNRGLTLGDLPAPHDSVRVIAWGDGRMPFVTRGEILESLFIFYWGKEASVRTLTTAFVIPGSSGGPLVNDDNELVGISVIAYSETAFSNDVPMPVIVQFLKDVK